MPTSTDLVTDLPADFEVFGQAVDTSLADLKGGTTGQVLSKASNTNMDFTWVTTDDANAIQNSIVDAKGDIVAASANDTPARLAVGNNGETLVADSSTSTGLRYQANFAAGKNKIINGDFGIWQRGTSFTTAGYTADRFTFTLGGGSGAATVSQQSFTAGTAPVAGYEGTFFGRWNQTTGASGNPTFRQKIEDVRTFAGQTITVSFWAKVASAGTPLASVVLEQDFGSGGSGSVNTTFVSSPSLTTAWTRYSYTVSAPSISGKTIGTGSNLAVVFYGNSSSTYTFDIWGVQLEAGSVATAFQTATGTLQGELAACQRYYIQNALGVNFFTTGAVYSGTSARFTLPNPVTLRTTPTGLVTQNLTVSIPRTGGTVNTGTWAITYATPNTTTVTYTHGTSVLTAGDVAEAYGNNANSYIGWSAEL
jgi:hypothetical protein